MSVKRTATQPASITRESPEEEAIDQLLRAAEDISNGLQRTLKRQGLSFPQYSVLRVLRQAGDPGLPSSAISDRLPTRDSDITRLVDRLVDKGLAARSRQDQDRRVVRIRITATGLDRVQELDRPVSQWIQGRFAGIKPKRIRRLLELLRQVCPGGN